MTLTDERRAELIAYCRIDEMGPGDELLLDTIYFSAVGYLAGAGVSQPEEGTYRRAQYDLLINRMVLDDWDHRGAHSAGQTYEELPGFRTALNQMKLTEPAVSELDTAGAGA